MYVLTGARLHCCCDCFESESGSSNLFSKDLVYFFNDFNWNKLGRILFNIENHSKMAKNGKNDKTFSSFYQ